MTVDDVIVGILEREGGYVNHKADRGGPTKHGITAATLGKYRKLGRPATPREVEALEGPEAFAIYYTNYVIAPGFEKLPAPILAQVVDDGVLSGQKTATMALQRVLHVPADGVIGPQTRDALSRADTVALSKALVADRAIRLARIVKNDPSQAVFIEGWIRRAMNFL
jgi:lysozyme family protein